jgi:hypothetical protein
MSSDLRAQDDKKYELYFADVFVIKVTLSNSVLQSKSYCVYKNGTLCNLYKINVDRILYCPGNTVMDSIKLLNIQYLLVPSSYGDSLVLGKELLITAMPSANVNYLAFSKILDRKLGVGYSFYHKHAYLSGLIKCNCRKKDSFEKYISSNALLYKNQNN